MAIKSDAEIYRIIEAHIKASSEPLTCVALWEHNDVREHARSPEKVSDFLGLMWRRNLLQRWSAPKTSTDRSRYAYSWVEDTEANKPKKVDVMSLVDTRHKKSNVTVTEDGNRIILDFDKFTLIVQAKG